jgi:LacI family transcriptional regulator
MNFSCERVITNDYECGYISAEHLIENGCKNPVFLSISSCLGICKKRADGFMAALKDKKVKNTVIECKGDNSEVYSQIKTLLSSKNRPDGLVASVERLALSVYLVCNETGLSIPHQLKVLVFSTMETASILNPPLTTITQPAFEIGKTAAETLFKEIEKKSFYLSDEIIVLPSVLTQRDSSWAHKIPSQ